MTNKEYGSYHFKEGFYIDECNFNGGSVESVILHEATHRDSFIYSTFGTFYRMWSKLLNVPEFRKTKPLFDCFQNYFKKMQEQAATYNEIVRELSELGVGEYNDYIEQYREENIRYYKYFNEIKQSSKGVLGVGNIKKINTAQNTDGLYGIINDVLRLSFSIDITKFNVEKWSKISDIERNIAQNEQLNPNIRFKKVLKALVFDQSKNCIHFDEELLKGIEIVDYKNYDLNTYVDIFVRLFGEDHYTIILSLLSRTGVEMDESIIMDKSLAAYPALSNFLIKKNLFLNKITMLDISELLIRKTKFRYLNILTQCQFQVWSTQLINENEILTTPDAIGFWGIDNHVNLINKLTRDTDLIVTTSAKLPMEILEKIDSETFIFMTRPISENLRYIKDEYKNGDYNIVSNNNFNYLLVKKNNTLLIQPIISSQIELVRKKMDSIANKVLLMVLFEKVIDVINLHFMDMQMNQDETMINTFLKNRHAAEAAYYLWCGENYK